MAGRVAGVAATLVAAGLLLTGCVVAPLDPTRPPEPTPTRSSRPDAVAPPTDAPTPGPEPVVAVDPAVTHLVVRPEHLDLVNGAGAVVRELPYDAEAQAFVDALSGVLGGPPDVEERPGGHEWLPTTRYTWPGVIVVDDHESGEHEADMNVSVRFTLPLVGSGIGVSTMQGFRPGDDPRAFAEELGEA